MWMKGTHGKFPSARDHSSDCYFCIVKMSGYNKKNKCKVEYPSLPSAVHPVPHSVEIPASVFKEIPFLEIQEYESEHRNDPCEEDFEADDSIHNGIIL